MHPVHRVAGLESNHVGIAHLSQTRPGLGRGQAEFGEIVINREVEDLQLTADAKFAPARHLGNDRVLEVGGAINLFSLFLPVEAEDLFQLHHSHDLVVHVA